MRQITKAAAITLLIGVVVTLAVGQSSTPALITSNVVGINYPSGFSIAYQGIPYAKVFSATPGAVAPITWSSTGSFPTGLSLNTSTGLLSGTPTSTGSSSFTISWIDSAIPPHGATSGSLSITPSALSSITVSPTGQSIQTAATLQMAAQCNWALYSATTCTNFVVWSATGAGTINASTGLLTAGGSAGTATPTATLNSVPGSTTVTVANNNPNPTITNSPTLPTPGCVVNFPCPTTQLNATGGSGTGYTWTIVSGAPTGCGGTCVSSSGVYSLTPSAAGNYNAFIIRVTDSMGGTSTQTFTQLVASPSTNTASASPTTVALNGQAQATAITTFSDTSTQNVTMGNASARVVQYVSNPCNSASSCIATITPTLATDGMIVYLHQGADTVSPFTVTDSGSQSYTIAGTINTLNGDSTAIYYLANTAAGITMVTGSTSAAASAFRITVVEVAGTVTSSMLDAVVNNGNTTSALSDVTGSLSTSTATDFIIDCVNTGSQTGYSGVAPFAIPATGGTSDRTACQAEFVTLIQSGLLATMNWSPTSTPHSSIFAAFKLTAGNPGAVWGSAPGTGNCSVNANGAILGTAVGTCTIFYNYGGAAQSNSVTITINGGASDTALIINPNTGSGTVNGANTQFQAVGNVTNSSYTTTGTWASNNTTIAQSLGGGAFKCLANGNTTVTVSFPSLTSGTATLQCSTVLTTSLLSGCGVTGANPTSTASVTGCNNTWPPAGYTLACADGGEATTEPACGAVYAVSPAGTTLSTSKPHVGTHSFLGTFTGDAALVGIHYGLGSTLGNVTWHTLYGSIWIYEDSNGMFANSDFNWFYIYPPASTGCTNGIGMDAEQTWAGNTIRSSLNSGIQASGLGVTGGNPPGGCPGQFLDNGFNYIMPAGRWVQYEFLFTPSTFGTPPITNPAINCNSLTPTTPGCGNGTFQVWINGSLVVNHLNSNTNGTIPMSPNGDALMGGLITSFIDINNESAGRCSVFSATGGGTCPGTQPGTGAPQPFKRWIDDIILIYK